MLEFENVGGGGVGVPDKASIGYYGGKEGCVVEGHGFLLMPQEPPART